MHDLVIIMEIIWSMSVQHIFSRNVINYGYFYFVLVGKPLCLIALNDYQTP